MTQFFTKEWLALLITVAFSMQGHATAYVTYQYDKFGRLTTQHTGGQLTMQRRMMKTLITPLVLGIFLSTTVYGQPQSICYHYDAQNRVVALTYSNGFVRKQTYDHYGALANLSYQQHDQPISWLAYHYNQLGQITQVVRTQGSTQAQWHYGYDHDHNLQTVACAGALCPVDAQGQQLTSQTYHFDALNNIQQVISNQTTTTYQYDPALPTRLIRFTNSNPRYPSSPTLHYDPAGHLLNDSQQHVLTYTPLEQVRSVTSTTSATPLVQYHYNGNNQQVSVAVPKHTPTYLLYGQDHLLTQQQGQEKTSYLYGVQRLGQQNDTHPPTWYLTNVQGSVLQTSQTTLSPAIIYSPYGQESTSGAKPQASHFGFDGQLTDGVTGWQFLGQGYRAYNPELRRFLQQDSLSPFGKAGKNGYVFANNDPINQFDPTGHFPYQILGNTMLMVGLFFGIASGLSTAESLAIAAGIIDNALNGSGMILTNIDESKPLSTKEFMTDVGFGLLSGAIMGYVGGKIYGLINKADDLGLNLLRDRAYKVLQEEGSHSAKLAELVHLPKPGNMLTAFMAYGGRTASMEAVRTITFTLPAQLIEHGHIQWDKTTKEFGINLAIGFAVGGLTNSLATRWGNMLSLSDFPLGRTTLPGGVTLRPFFGNWAILTGLQLGLPKVEGIMYNKLGSSKDV